MERKHRAKLEKVFFSDVRDELSKIHPTLCKIIDNLSPGKDFPLYKAHYPFGSKIVHAGVFYLPTDEGDVVPIHSSNIPDTVKNDLSRRFLPIGLVTKNHSEVFYETPERIILLNLFKPSYIVGLWEHLDPAESYYVKCLWTWISGTRSLYLLPKITDATGHKELRSKYSVRSRIPKTLSEQWNVFYQLANSQAFNCEWNSEILFFSDKWIEKAISDAGWKDLYNFMLKDGWNQSQYWRNKVTFDIVWELFIEQNLKPNPYLVHIVKHIILIGNGVLPAFAPAVDDTCAPIKTMQKIFIEDYKLRDYIPTFMQPTFFDMKGDSQSMVYYSLQQPTLLETSLASKNLQSVIKAIPEIAYLIDTFKLEVEEGSIKAQDTPIETFARKVNFDYFHNEINPNLDYVRHTGQMPSEDKNLLSTPTSNNRIFAETSKFINGCVRISSKP